MKITAFCVLGLSFFVGSVEGSEGALRKSSRIDNLGTHDNSQESSDAWDFHRQLNEIKLVPTDGVAGNRFGRSVAISGDTVLVGSYGTPQVGAVYVFSASSGQQTRKLQPTGGSSGDYFGYSIAISGDHVVVGAYTDNDNFTGGGAVYVFSLSTGDERFKLKPTDPAMNDYFGAKVAVDGNIVVIGANRKNNWKGAAYVFSAVDGNQLHKLQPSDLANSDNFGFNVGVSGDNVVVSSIRDDVIGSDSGSAYIFSASTGTQLHKLSPGDGSKDDLFGYGVAISGDTVVVGAPFDDDNGSDSGSAYIFSASTGTQLHKLSPDDGSAGDEFGRGVAVSGDAVVVGAWKDDDNGMDSGSAYTFSASTGAQLEKFTAGNGNIDDNFGISVAVSGATAVVGAWRDDDNGSDNSGSASVYTTSSFTDPPTLNPSAAPSGVPSSKPTASSNPSATPTGVPSSNPSAVPSGVPSSKPSAVPSGVPSSKPTASSNPSAIPTGVPSSNPSAVPSSNPSAVPSGVPSSNPSAVPSGVPSSKPSAVPSGVPSSNPSAVLSGIPSSKPTASSNPTTLFGGGPPDCENCQGACIEVYIMTDNDPKRFQWKIKSTWFFGGEKQKWVFKREKGYYTKKNTLYSEGVCYTNPNTLVTIRVQSGSQRDHFEGYYSLIVDNGTRKTYRNRASFRRKHVTKIRFGDLRSNIIEI